MLRSTDDLSINTQDIYTRDHYLYAPSERVSTNVQFRSGRPSHAPLVAPLPLVASSRTRPHTAAAFPAGPPPLRGQEHEHPHHAQEVARGFMPLSASVGVISRVVAGEKAPKPASLLGTGGPWRCCCGWCGTAARALVALLCRIGVKAHVSLHQLVVSLPVEGEQMMGWGSGRGYGQATQTARGGMFGWRHVVCIYLYALYKRP